jgi:hypothetical protein
MSNNTVIQLKKSADTGNTPGTANLSYGELAINYADGKLFYKNNLDQIKSIYLPNLYETVNVNGTLLVPTSATEILTFKPDAYINITGASGNDTIIISESISPIALYANAMAIASYAHANASYDKANVANSLAQAAFNDSNTRLSLSGGTVSGNVIITGNLTVQGTLTSVNTQVLSVTDSLIELANNNTSDTLDIGFYGNYSNGTSNLFTGLVRSDTDKIYYLFDTLTEHPSNTSINFGNAKAATLNANVVANSVLISGVNVLTHANAAFNLANTSIQNTGGTINGNLTVNGDLRLSDVQLFSNTVAITSNTQEIVDTFTASSWRTAKYTVQISESSTNYHSTDILLIHDGSTVHKVEYAVVTTTGELGIFDADINTGSVRLLFTATDATNKTLKVVRTLIES